MNKVLACLLVFVLLGAVACAESVDLMSMSDEELLKLYSDVESCLAERGLMDGEKLVEGKYIVGETIQEGTYILRCIEILNSDREYMYIRIRPIEAVSNLEYIADFHPVLAEECSVTLKEGYCLLIDSGTCIIEPSAPSFAP